MRIDVLTLFPEMFSGPMSASLLGKAIDNGILDIQYTNPREFTEDVHQKVDDAPYGGGPGMVMKCEPLTGAVAAAKKRSPDGSPVVYLSPQGRVFDQASANRFAELPGLILLAGRYVGVDERFIESQVDEEL